MSENQELDQAKAVVLSIIKAAGGSIKAHALFNTLCPHEDANAMCIELGFLPDDEIRITNSGLARVAQL